MANILVLGAGFGGLTAATELRTKLVKDHRITIVDQKSHFLMGLAKLWAMDGRRGLDEGRRPLARLKERGVDFIEGTIERVDVGERFAMVSGQRVPYDHLIVALGAELRPKALAGFEAAHNLYSEEGITKLRQALEKIEQGKVLVAITSIPFKCPPAPYEAVLLLDSMLRQKGVRSKTTIEFTTPEPHPLPVAPPEYGARLIPLLKSKDVEYFPNWKPKAIHADRKEVEYDTGARKQYDLLVGVPTHRAPEVLKSSGLTDASGWVPVDALTFRTPYPNTWAVGDCVFVKLANGKPLPKAGILAEGQAKIVAEHVAAEIEGRKPKTSFDGKGFCFLEVGDGQAMEAHGDFYAQPNPVFRFEEISAASLARKQAFESDRLKAWFGA